MSVLAGWMKNGLLNEQAALKLFRFRDLILEWNSRINLTGYRNGDLIEEILIGESIRGYRAIRLRGKEVLDFGSGAGIPGLVWSICDPELVLLSLEVRQKKVAFQKEVARQLKLDVQIRSGRFPDEVRDAEFDWIVTRAIRFDPSLWSAAEGMVRRGGGLVRFGAVSGSAPPGWDSIRISERSMLHVRRNRST